MRRIEGLADDGKRFSSGWKLYVVGWFFLRTRGGVRGGDELEVHPPSGPDRVVGGLREAMEALPSERTVCMEQGATPTSPECILWY